MYQDADFNNSKAKEFIILFWNILPSLRSALCALRLGIAQGSNAELETQIILCEELELIDKEKLERAKELVTEIRRMLLTIQQKLSSPQS